MKAFHEANRNDPPRREKVEWKSGNGSRNHGGPIRIVANPDGTLNGVFDQRGKEKRAQETAASENVESEDHTTPSNPARNEYTPASASSSSKAISSEVAELIKKAGEDSMSLHEAHQDDPVTPEMIKHREWKAGNGPRNHGGPIRILADSDGNLTKYGKKKWAQWGASLPAAEATKQKEGKGDLEGGMESGRTTTQGDE